ncbi:hypothetical protein [Devosia sp. A16]|uniref:hypothetical protein n=1 Tax=Devosia sp. A16 TaxID=1736675 RepID=UPI0006D7A222|nr:hypothetical protein [Devosia sp. A16]
MISESRKANRDSFASQRARLHFSGVPPVAGIGILKGIGQDVTTPPRTRRDIVREGLIGFVPVGAH